MPVRLLGLVKCNVYVCMYVSTYQMTETGIMNWKECGKHQSRLNLRYYCRIYVEGVRKPTRHAVPGRDLNLGLVDMKHLTTKFCLSIINILHKTVKTILPSIAFSDYSMTLACI